jgi:hypothetical protein
MQQRKKEKRKVGRGTNASFGAVSFEKQTNKQTNKHGTKEKLKVAGVFFFFRNGLATRENNGSRNRCDNGRSLYRIVCSHLYINMPVVYLFM